MRTALPTKLRSWPSDKSIKLIREARLFVARQGTALFVRDRHAGLHRARASQASRRVPDCRPHHRCTVLHIPATCPAQPTNALQEDVARSDSYQLVVPLVRRDAADEEQASTKPREHAVKPASCSLGEPSRQKRDWLHNHVCVPGASEIDGAEPRIRKSDRSYINKRRQCFNSLLL
jgi:hypothetical protein